MEMKRSNSAVSEILSTILLLMIAISFFSSMYWVILSPPNTSPAPIVTITGTVSENTIILEHHGGEPLSPDTELRITIDGNTENVKIGDYLVGESMEDGLWGPSEKITYPIIYDSDLVQKQANIMVVDGESESVVMTGIVNVVPTGDIGIEVTVDKQHLKTGEAVLFTITATNYGNLDASDVIIEFIFPEGLIHHSNNTLNGAFKNSTGCWSLGTLNGNQSAVLEIIAIIEDRGLKLPAQLLMILDGSGSIQAADWQIQIDGLAAAIENSSIFPHDGTVELTVIQFGGGSWGSDNPPSFAQIEIAPILVNETNNVIIANNVRNMDQLEGMTPTPCGIYLGADTVDKSIIYDHTTRQVIMLVTDGKPNRCSNEAIKYTSYSEGCNAFTSSEMARDYLIKTLDLTADQDEFDVIAVGNVENSGAEWLKDDIIWPQPGYYAPPFRITSPVQGWIRIVANYQEFAGTIDETFGNIFYDRLNVVSKIEASNLFDPRDANDLVKTVLRVHSS